MNTQLKTPLQEISEPITAVSNAISDVAQLGKSFADVRNVPKLINESSRAEIESLRLFREEVMKCPELPMTINFNGISMASPGAVQLYKEIQKSNLIREISEEINFRDTCLRAGEKISEDNKEELEELDYNWFERFRKYCSMVDDSMMRDMWASVLDSQLTKKKSFSVGTLEIINRLSRDEAILFSKVLGLVFMDRVIYNNEEYFEKVNIKFEDLLLLENYGLINLTNTNLTVTVRNNLPVKRIDMSKKIIYIITTDQPIVQFEIPTYSLTKFGKELASIVEPIANSEGIVEALRMIKTNNNQLHVSCHEINYINKENVNHSVNDLLSDVL